MNNLLWFSNTDSERQFPPPRLCNGHVQHRNASPNKFRKLGTAFPLLRATSTCLPSLMQTKTHSPLWRNKILSLEFKIELRPAPAVFRKATPCASKCCNIRWHPKNVQEAASNMSPLSLASTRNPKFLKRGQHLRLCCNRLARENDRFARNFLKGANQMRSQVR